MNSVLIIFTAVSFLGYGSTCFFSKHMEREFTRYGLRLQRFAVGGLQWAAGVGLLLGMIEPWLGRSAAAGLAAMMLVAVAVRIRIKDGLLETMPALFYLLLNIYLCLAAY